MLTLSFPKMPCYRLGKRAVSRFRAYAASKVRLCLWSGEMSRTACTASEEAAAKALPQPGKSHRKGAAA